MRVGSHRKKPLGSVFCLVFAWPISFFPFFSFSSFFHVFPASLSGPVLRWHRLVYPLLHRAHWQQEGATALACGYLSSSADVPFEPFSLHIQDGATRHTEQGQASSLRRGRFSKRAKAGRDWSWVQAAPRLKYARLVVAARAPCRTHSVTLCATTAMWEGGESELFVVHGPCRDVY